MSDRSREDYFKVDIRTNIPAHTYTHKIDERHNFGSGVAVSSSFFGVDGVVVEAKVEKSLAEHQFYNHILVLLFGLLINNSQDVISSVFIFQLKILQIYMNYYNFSFPGPSWAKSQ